MAGDHAASSGRIPFWVHQVVELLLGVLLLVEGARTGEHTVVLASLGGVLLVLALCSDGPLGAWPWIGRRAHRVLDVVVALVLAASPVLLGLDGVLAIVILESAAAGMLWLALRTEWRARARRRPRERPAPPHPPQPAPPTREPSTTEGFTAGSPGARTPEVPLARKLGSAVGRARDDGPRQLGRLVGRAQRAARAAMAPETPPTTPGTAAQPPPGSEGRSDDAPAP